MFKAVDEQTGNDIIILDEKWDEFTINYLKLIGKSRFLSCPVCKKAVFVKAGEIKSWHFAHFSIEDCPLKNESSAILKARSIIYKWLQSKFPEKVSIEKNVKNEFIPRPIDCYVESEKENIILYWIIESGIRSRTELKYALSNITININWVFINNILKLEDKDNFVYLSPTERDFAYESKYNRLYNFGKSIHYLDINENIIITLRGLHLIHAPQQYYFEKKLINKIEDMLVSSKKGEFVHPGEYEKLLEYKQIENIKNTQKGQFVSKQVKNYSHYIEPENKIIYQNSNKNRDTYDQPVKTDSILTKPVPCEICNVITKDWFSLDTGSGKCLCKKCFDNKHKNGY